jgi:outer membrane protein OmpA-like peptidoglycan-associated protein
MNRRNLLPLALLVPLAACAGPNRDPAAEPLRVVFFQGESATLDAPARAVVTQAAQAARGVGTARITLQGYGGPVGGAGFNRVLAEARSRHVTDLLREAGVPAERVTIQSRGAVPAEMAPIEARRVDMRITAP